MTLLKCSNCIFFQSEIGHYARKQLYLIYPWKTMTYFHLWKFEEKWVSGYFQSRISYYNYQSSIALYFSISYMCKVHFF